MFFTEVRTLSNLHVATEFQNIENSTLHYDEIATMVAREQVPFRLLLETRPMQWAYLMKIETHQKGYLILSKNAWKISVDNLGQTAKSDERPKLLLNIKNIKH